MLNTSPDVVGLTDLQGRIQMVSPAILKLLRCEREEDVLGRPLTDFLVPADRPRALERIAAILGGTPPSPTEYTGLRPDGSTVAVEVNSQFIRGADGRPTEMILLVRDITTRKLADAALRASEERYRSILNASPDNVTITDLAGRIVLVSPAGLATMGYTKEAEVVGRPVQDFIAEEDRPRAAENIARMFQGILTGPEEYRGRRADGSAIDLEVNGEFIRGGDGQPREIVFIVRDITERKRAEDLLRLSLKEKEGLLREVHHRVKNNLQVISSLLRLETSRSPAPDTKRVLGDMQGRILSMAVLHETLYKSGRFGQVDLGNYLRQLAEQLFRAAASSTRLRLELQPVFIEIDQAIPCGLIVNELLTNSLKHAFADGTTGEVAMSLALNTQGEVQINVADTGVGLPSDFDTRRVRSLGLLLVTDLVRQIGGRLVIGPGPGAAFGVTFTPVLTHLPGSTSNPHGLDPHGDPTR
jgi:PAS domain S-box-containing protein